MEVADVEVIPVKMGVTSLKEGGIAPYKGKYSSVETVDRILLRLETNTGIVGWGEIRPSPSVKSATAILRNEVIPEALGRDVWEIESFLGCFHYEYLDLKSYVAGVEMAMWDALGKHLDAPLHQLLGGKCTEEVPVSSPLGILSPERSREYARKALEAGFDVLKVKAGRNWQTDVDRVIAMNDEVNGQLELRVDPNQGWNFEDAVRVGAQLEDAGIFLQYLEQPVRIDSFGTYKRLRNRLTTPMGINEDAYFQRNLSHLLKEDAIDVAVVDLVPAGGILKLKSQAAVAADHGISVAHHDAFDLGIKKAAVLHSVASTRAINLAVDTVYLAWDDYIIEDPHRISGGKMPVPDGPGLGVTVNSDKLETYRTD